MTIAAIPAARLAPGTFFGERGRATRAGDLILSENHYPSALQVPRHVHERAYFGLLLRGGYVEDLGRRRVVAFEPASVVFHPPREVRCGGIGQKGATLFHAEVPDGWVRRLEEHGGLPDEAIVRRGGPLVRLAMALYRELAAADTAAALVSEGLVLEMLGLLARRPQRAERTPPHWLAEAVDLVHAEYQAPLTVRSVAERVGIAAATLARGFRRHRGESIGDCVRRLRVERARLLIRDGASDLASVALEAGFADQSHFTRIFRRLVGTTPGEYRRSVRT
jgi:AraC family transcriptional regulator